MTFSKIPSNCNVEGANLLCNLNQGQALSTGSKDTITIVYDISNLKGESVIIKAFVFSSGNESYINDNFVEDEIYLKRISTLDIMG